MQIRQTLTDCRQEKRVSSRPSPGGRIDVDTTDHQPVILARQGFAARHLRPLRQLVAWAAHRVGLNRARGQALALAVTEAAGNAINHGGGRGQLELIQDDNRALIAQISDNGPGLPANPPAALPPADETAGRGMYLIEQTCDRVEYRTGPWGTTVLLEMKLDDG
jgi:serine/threonine-protein kinase RsbW